MSKRHDSADASTAEFRLPAGASRLLRWQVPEVFVEVVEQRGDVAADELDGTVGEQTGSDHVVDDRAGQVRGVGGGLDDDGQTGDEHRTELLEHAPDGEVEGVDLQRESLPGVRM